MTRTIGGFIGLEPRSTARGPFHDTLALSTGRACLAAIVDLVQPVRVHLPFYVCDTALAPLRSRGIECVFHRIDRRLRPAPLDELPTNGDRDLHVFVNYFGVLGSAALEFALRAATRGAVDNSQAFFHRGRNGSWSFNSARKFFGVPDGAYLCGPHRPDRVLPPAHLDTEYLRQRAEGEGERAFQAFRRHEAALDDEIRAMSEMASACLAAVDYERVAYRRRANYVCLDRALGPMNRLCLPLSDQDVPHSYPFLPPVPMRDDLVRHGIFVPQFWPEIAARHGEGFEWERELASLLCPLPVDQRYDAADMAEVVSVVRRLLAG